jgi:pimeloyl-ACP methyl ester carboxylesterase
MQRLPMLHHGYADVNGVRLHYVTAGTGKLILFLHGFPEFWYAWKDQLIEFAATHQAVAPDLRGYNLSSKPAEVEQYEVPLLVEDVRALAEHFGHDRFILVGHDWGGAVAWATALYHPERIEKLVIINAPHPGIFGRELRSNPAQQQASQYMLLFRSPQAEAFLSAKQYAYLVEAVLGPRLRRGYFTEEDRAAYLAAWSQPGALTGGLNYYRAARVGPPSSAAEPPIALPSDLPSLTVKVPTLVIWGEKDIHLLAGNLEGLEGFVPDLTVLRIPDGTHWVVHEKPAVINAAIREFISARHEKAESA